MPSKPLYLKSLYLVVLSVVLTAITGVMGAVPLRALRELLGRGVYSLLGTGLSIGFYALGFGAQAILLMTLFVLIGLYKEFENHGYPLVSAGLQSVIITSLLLGASFFLWIYRQGASWYSVLEEKANLVITQMNAVGSSNAFKFSAEDVIAQVPSGIIVFLIIALMLSLMFNRRTVKGASRDRLLDFKVPDVFVWLFIFSLLGSFLKTDAKWLKLASTNVLNVCVVLFFFQGIAVVTHLFETFKVGVFWRSLWYFILIIQLSLFLSLIGLLDFWIDFRSWFLKKSAQMKKTM